jgi:uncharacterized protein with PIN domain
MTDGVRKVTIPPQNPVNAITMAGIVKDAGLTIDGSRKLLFGECFAYAVAKTLGEPLLAKGG